MDPRYFDMAADPTKDKKAWEAFKQNLKLALDDLYRACNTGGVGPTAGPPGPRGMTGPPGVGIAGAAGIQGPPGPETSERAWFLA